MKKRTFALLLCICLTAGLLTACGQKKAVTADEAIAIALEHAQLSRSDATDVHTHVVTEQGLPCYSIHITTADGELSVVINAATGEVIK